MIKVKTWAIWIGVLLCLSPIAWSATSAKITAVNISHQADVTRFVFQLSGASHYHWTTQTKPLQLRFVLDDAILATSLPKSGLIGTPVQSCQLISKAGKAPTTIKFILKTPVKVKVYSLPPSSRYGDRLVLELRLASAKSQPKKSSSQSAKAITPVTESVEEMPPPDVSVPKPVKKPKRAASLSDQDANQVITVVIDPGHGGKDPGATGPGNTHEKNVVLAISKLLQQDFNQQSGFQAKLTRDRDVFIPLRQRLAIARQAKADLFIAIHADAAYKNSAVGASVFALSERGATSEMARWLANRENESESIYGVTGTQDQVLRSVLLDLSQTHTIAVSLEMGQFILDKLSNITRLHYRRVEQAAFVVLKSPDIPSLLVETGYITNPKQESMLNDPEYQQQLATAIVQGVMMYFSQHPQTKRLVTS